MRTTVRNINVTESNRDSVIRYIEQNIPVRLYHSLPFIARLSVNDLSLCLDDVSTTVISEFTPDDWQQFYDVFGEIYSNKYRK